ncbi:MAG TPA: hypothetical protein VFQ11_04655 [Nocardioidaceae bacterium]|jgi:hypothetical protein|nr:hypothetical protein [Nocardioidaceae bacterium]
MRRTLPITLGVVMVVVGAVWTFQGLGYVKGSPMTGVEVWAVVGPIVAGLGVALAYLGVRGSQG